jgi:hypothetical protein
MNSLSHPTLRNWNGRVVGTLRPAETLANLGMR